MFEILFGWPKASKCKKTIKRARCRLGIVKNKRQAIATQSRKDLAELLQNGHEEIAIKRAEQLIQDESMVAAYELLDHFCEIILKKLSFIRRHKECPDEINEAVSSLIFASARCGDLPELCVIRKLFGQRYGHKFATAAVELYSGNLVSKKVVENLSVNSVSYDVRHRVVDEIARDNCIQLKVLALQYHPDWHQSQVKDYEGYQLVEETRESDTQISEESKIHPSEDEEIERGIICVDSSMSNTSVNLSVPEHCLTEDTSALVSIVQQYPLQDSPETISFPASDLENKGEAMALVSSSEIVSFPPYVKAMVDSAEEIEGSHFFLSAEGFCDQYTIQSGCAEIDMDQDENSSIRSSRKSKREPKKRPMRRSTLFENQCLMDIGYMVYYHKSKRSPSAYKHSYPQKRHKQYSSPEKEKSLHFSPCQGGAKSKSLKLDMCDCCSLDQPCYSSVYKDQDCMDLVAIPQSPSRESYYSGTFEDHLLITYPDNHCGKPNNEMELESSLVSYAFPIVPDQMNCDSLTRTETPAQISRALSMPLEWHKSSKDKILRSNSYCPEEKPKHVHPKLPDYEDIYAKFIALKRERLEHKGSNR